MSTVLYRRSARRPAPAMPKGEVLFEAPPELPEVTASGGMQRIVSILPMFAGAGAMAFMFSMNSGSGGGNNSMMTMRMVVMGMMALSMGGMYLSTMGGGGKGGERKQQINSGRRDYLRYLTQLRRRVRQAGQRQREALEWRYPAPDALWAVPLSRRLWERRPSDNDFGHIRLACGRQQFVLKLVPPETKPVEDLDPVTSGALRRFIRAYRTVPDLPVALSLRGFAQVHVDGDPDRARALARAVIAHLATFHAPHELVVAVCASVERRGHWDWAKWLPHALHPTKTDGAGNVRLVANSLSEIERLVADLVANRPFFASKGSPVTDQPHLVVFIDGGQATYDSKLLSSPAQGVTIVDVATGVIRGQGEGILRLAIDGDEIATVSRDVDGSVKRRVLGRPDELSTVEAESLARSLAPYRSAVAGASVDEVQEEEAEPQVTDMSMPGLLGIPDAFALDTSVIWRPRPQRDRLRIPFGVGETGRPVDLDIKESAQGGMGPHGLVIGATGSGKSELLRTIVLGLAMVHSSDALNLILVDFKGGATFLGLDTLPHTSAVITNLEDELILVDRMQDAIAGEMNRRQELLRSAGNYASLRDYEAAREKGAALDPLPSLWIVVDEFSELLSAKPEFAELFVMIGRLGRSLGVHLLLASQRLEEGKLRGLDTHLSYRIGLRTFSAGESRSVLGVPDAYELPNEPGHGYLKAGTDGLVRFKASYVSGPYHRPTGTAAAPATPEQVEVQYLPQISAYTTDRVEPKVVEIPEEPEEEAAPQETKDAEVADVFLDLVVGQLRDQGRPAHKVWLPPLDEPSTLDQLLPPLEATESEGLAPAGWTGRGQLRAPVAIVDKPYDQRRDPMWVDLSGASGNVAVVGSPQSGKSTALRSIISALALTHTPDEVQFYCLDFGGGTLSTISQLPHVGGVAARLETDAVRRTIGELTSLLDQREAAFTEHGIDSIASYRRARKAGTVPADRFAPDVFLVVDGWATVRQEYEEQEATISQLAARGLGFGIHVMASSGKYQEFRSQIRDLLQTRIELRLGDAFDSEVNRKIAVNVPADRPGRGLNPDGMHLLTALPRIDGVQSDHDLADGARDMAKKVAAAWKGAPAPRVRLLPMELPLTELPQPGSDIKRGVPIGIDENELAPVYLDFDDEPHFVVFGATECGKSNLLTNIARGIVARKTPDEAKIVMVDYQRSQLDAISGDHLIGYAASSDAATSMLRDLAQVIKGRQPGPDLTPEQLKRRDWWSGSDLYIIVDDYDLVATRMGSPVEPMAEFTSQARDLGLHWIIARSFGGASRAMMDPVIQRIKDAGNPGMIMSGTRDEGALWGNVRGTPLPPGRGTLVSRRTGTRLVQTAYEKPEDESVD